jgi:hypothetical protein
LVAVALDATRFSAAVGEHFADIVDPATDINGDTLRELGCLDDDTPATQSILRHMRLDETQL